MAIKNDNLLQEVQTLNQTLETSDTQAIQNKISSRLFGLFDNRPNVVLNEEFLAELEKTGNLAALGNRIITTTNKLNNVLIQVNGNPVANTVVNRANMTSTQIIENEIKAINGTYTPQLNNLPTQIQRIRARLNENRRILQQIEDVQTNINNITNPGATQQTIQNTINDLQTQISACSSIRSILEQIASIEGNPSLNETDNNGRPTNRANTLTGQLNTLRQNLVRQLTTQRTNLPTAAQNINQGNNTQADITTLTQQELNLNHQLDAQRQALTNAQELLRLNTELQRITRSLSQQQMPVPQNVGLNIASMVILPNQITTIANTQNLIIQVDAEIQQLDNLDNEIQNIRDRYKENVDTLNKMLPLQKLQEGLQRLNFTPGLINTRATEIQNFINIGQQYLLIRQNGFIPEAGQFTLDIGGNITPINLNNIFIPQNNLPINYRANYAICNNTGEALTRTGNQFDAQLIGGQNVKIRGLNINNANQLYGNNVEISPLENVTFPAQLALNVRIRIQDPATGINVDHYKPLNITINSPTLSLNDRQTAYNNLNQNNTVNTRLAAEYSDPNRTTIENEVIWEILRANGNKEEIDKIYNNEQQRNILIERIRNIPWLIPVFTIANLQAGFMNEMTRLDRDIPIQHLVSINAFTDYLRNNLSENVKTFVKERIANAINTSNNRNNILRTLMNFQSDVVNNKLDTNDHMTLDTNVPNTRPQGHPNSRWQRLTGRRSNRNNRTKFFDGRESKAFEDKLETNEGELGFDLKVAVHGVNKLVTTINIKGEDEPVILDTRDVNEMVHMILRLEATKSGEPINRKLRCRMALAAVKAVVSMSPVTLHRQYNGIVTAVDGRNYNIDRVSAHIRGGNLIVRGSCAAGHVNRQRNNHVIFDEQRYKGLHNINELERGMIALSNQTNDIMDAMGNEFREATSRIKTAPLMKYNTRHYLRLGPVKRLRGRMIYGQTNWNFDFDTSATAGSKTINIKFEKGKFILSGTFKGKPYEFKGRSLGKLIRKKKDRLRVFDGVELAIFEKINETMIEKLRNNNLVGPENFGAADLNPNKTGRIYIMDNHGDLSYLDIENRALNPIPNGNYGRIDFNNLPPQRIRCNTKERTEFMQNPLLSGRLIRAMRHRLHLF